MAAAFPENVGPGAQSPPCTTSILAGCIAIADDPRTWTAAHQPSTHNMSGLQAAAKARVASAARRIFGDFELTNGAGTGRKYLKAVNRAHGVLKYTPDQMRDFNFAGLPHAKALFQYDYKQYLKSQGDAKYEKLKERDGFHPDIHDVHKAHQLNAVKEEHDVGVGEVLPEEVASFSAAAEKGQLVSAVSLVESIVQRLEAAAEGAKEQEAATIEALLSSQRSRLETLQSALEALPEGDGEETVPEAAAAANSIAAIDPTALMGPGAVDSKAFPGYTMYAIARQRLGSAPSAGTASASSDQSSHHDEASGAAAPRAAAAAALAQYFQAIVPAPLHTLDQYKPGAIPVLAPPTPADAAAAAPSIDSGDYDEALQAAARGVEGDGVEAALQALLAGTAAAEDPAGLEAWAATMVSASLLHTFVTWLAAVRPSAAPASVGALDLEKYVPGVHSDVGSLELPLSALGTDEAALPALLSALLADATPFAQDERQLAGMPTGGMVTEEDLRLEEACAATVLDGAVDAWQSPTSLLEAAAEGGVTALPPSLRTQLRVQVVDHLMQAVAVLRGDEWAQADTLGVGQGLTAEQASERVEHFLSWLLPWAGEAKALQDKARLAAVFAVQDWVAAGSEKVDAWEAAVEADADSEVAASVPVLATGEAVRSAGMRRLQHLWRTVQYPTTAHALDAYAVHLVTTDRHPLALDLALPLGQAERA